MAQFHHVHGRSIRIDEGSTLASKDTSKFGSNWVFSRRDVKQNQIVCIKITEVGNYNGKRFEIGFTDEDPAFVSIRPKTTHMLCNKKLYVPHYDLHRGSELIIMYDLHERLVYFGIDGVLKGITSLYGPYDERQRWLAIKLDATVLGVQFKTFSDALWNFFVVESSRVAQSFKKVVNYNSGGTGLRKAILGFDRQVRDLRATINQTKAILEGNLQLPIVLNTNRVVYVNEVVQLRVTKATYGTTMYVYTSSSRNFNKRDDIEDKIAIHITRDETIQLLCSENGVLIQGRSSFVEASSRFAPITPCFLTFEISSMSTHCQLTFLDPAESSDIFATSENDFPDSLFSTKEANILRRVWKKTGLSHLSR